ncbi:MAG: hypothetical protein IJ121_02165 [Eubacterium sp.]|nr:hypothetical protein [Eubacterium sp.]
MKKERNIAFIVELLLLFMILLFVIVVITQTFMKSRGQSLYARHLTEAVTLAEEVAEVSASAEDLAEAAERFGAMEQVLEVQETQGETGETSGSGLVMAMEFAAKNGTRDEYRVELDWVEEKERVDAAERADAADGADTAAGGRFVTKQIRVYFADEQEPIYTLDAGDLKAF